jgi:alanyl-tRNA synthetase
MTEKIYLNDSYCRKFSATVLSCEKRDTGYEIVLDKTALFPEGGGQNADCGTIDGNSVIDVQEKNGVVVHTTEKEIPVGKEVECAIDWETRFARMQSHSGEHIVSGVAHTLFDCTNVGFHMSDSLMTVDLDKPLSAEDIAKIELLSNKAIYRNLEIKSIYPTKEELKTLDFRSKIELSDDARIVIIGDVDTCACCAPHVSRTGEIGIIKIVNAYSYKQGTRIEMLAGINALSDYASLNSANKELMGLLSASRFSVNETVAKQNEQLISLKTQNAQMSKRLALLELEPVNVGESVYAIAKNLNYDELRHCANALQEQGAKTCVLLSEADSGYIYVVASTTRDVREIVKELNAKFSGKGGGKPDYAQGKISDEIDIKIIEELL